MNSANEPKEGSLQAAVIVAAAVLAVGLMLSSDKGASMAPAPVGSPAATARLEAGAGLLPAKEAESLLRQMIDLGVIDPLKLPVVSELNLLWAIGLANTNPVLAEGPMMDPRYGGPQGFASVGGWTVGKGEPMDHYNHHGLVVLSPERQELVEKVAKQIFRPCCRNSTYFPDCNHGMAMLGYLEILADKGADESQLLAAAEIANESWFPELRRDRRSPQESGGCSV